MFSTFSTYNIDISIEASNTSKCWKLSIIPKDCMATNGHSASSHPCTEQAISFEGISCEDNFQYICVKSVKKALNLSEYISFQHYQM